MKFYLSAAVFLLTSALSNQVLADCPDTILDAGKYSKVRYHNNGYNVLKFACEKQGHDKQVKIPHRSGRDCAVKRVDGCSIPNSVKNIYTKRDLALMKASCNRHDLCYSTYGMSKHTCDKEFEDNLNFSRKKFGGTYVTSAIVGAVVIKGQDSYKNGQDWGKEHSCSVHSK